MPLHDVARFIDLVRGSAASLHEEAAAQRARPDVARAWLKVAWGYGSAMTTVSHLVLSLLLDVEYRNGTDTYFHIEASSLGQREWLAESTATYDWGQDDPTDTMDLVVAVARSHDELTRDVDVAVRRLRAVAKATAQNAPGMRFEGEVDWPDESALPASRHETHDSVEQFGHAMALVTRRLAVFKGQSVRAYDLYGYGHPPFGVEVGIDAFLRERRCPLWVDLRFPSGQLLRWQYDLGWSETALDIEISTS
jgi:hypothetical protein